MSHLRVQEADRARARDAPASARVAARGSQHSAARRRRVRLPHAGTRPAGPRRVRGPRADGRGTPRAAAALRGRGRPPKVGRRVPSPALLAAARPARWRKTTVEIYGRVLPLLVCTLTCLWPTVAGSRLVRVVVTRDPRGRFRDRAFFATDTKLRAEEILALFSHRWDLEVTFRDLKQVLGLAAPQNGWWRRGAGERSSGRRPGPAPQRVRARRAVECTVPSSSACTGSSCSGTSNTVRPRATSQRSVTSPLGADASGLRRSPTCSPRCAPRSCAPDFPRTRYRTGSGKKSCASQHRSAASLLEVRNSRLARRGHGAVLDVSGREAALHLGERRVASRIDGSLSGSRRSSGTA